MGSNHENDHDHDHEQEQGESHEEDGGHGDTIQIDGHGDEESTIEPERNAERLASVADSLAPCSVLGAGRWVQVSVR
ncbi:MAG: hypothetical protein J07HR59_01583 [Halorubrum sp. J07HR59]|nr:MAG: hypothetical protein J07HR59_01583 [Halorubrum sp. J07HR59]